MEAVGEAGVIEAQEVEGGGVEIVDVDRILGDIVTEVIGFSMDVAAFDACASHPDTEAAGMVVAAIVVGGEFALGVDGALLGGCFLREAPEGAIGSDRRAGKWGLAARRLLSAGGP